MLRKSRVLVSFLLNWYMTSKGNKKQLNNLVISKFQKLLHSTKRFLDGSETTYDFCPEIAPEYRRLEDERVRRVATKAILRPRHDQMSHTEPTTFFMFNPTFNSHSFLFVTIIILFCMQSQDWDRWSYKQWGTYHFCYDGNINGWNQMQHDGEEQWWPCIITLLVVQRSGNMRCYHSWPAQKEKKQKVSGNWSNENINRIVPVICRFQTPHGRTLIHLKQQHRTMPTAEPQGKWRAHQ